MTDYEIAAMLLAYDEGEPDEFDTWFAHWMKHLPEMAGEDHFGDCIKVPTTCCRCLHDEVMAIVPKVRAVIESKAQP